ncbi:MAG: glycosyltransferase N-terminal domain-containing protein, partial [Planctomycetota bacterium]|nr:glycosyltransferase N-terminal domain-containing protein [Planctomycetota bacterium]
MAPDRPNLLSVLTVNAAYAGAAVVGWPYYLYLLATRRKYRAHMGERWGLVPRLAPATQRFWVHAISVGEVEAARTFVPALREAYPEAEIVLSTTTLTGRERARQRLPDLPVFHFPLDLWPCVAAAFRRVRPTAVIQVESEWWPNFFFTAARRGVPVICVNVRLTEHGARGYRRMRPIMRQVLGCCSRIGVQADLYRDRLVGLGADPARIRVTGQMKHDGVTFADTVEGAEGLAREAGLSSGEPVLVAGSTGPGEEEPLLAAYRRLRREGSGLRLVIVPRRPENFEAAAGAIRSAGLPLLRRSEHAGAPGKDADSREQGATDCSSIGAAGTGNTVWQANRGTRHSEVEPPVVLGDTMGELMQWYALADVVFVGRSLAVLGGSNPMEPGSLAKPMVWGPEMFNFPVEAPALVAAGAARQVTGADDLADAV